MAAAEPVALLKNACCDMWTSPLARLLLGDRFHPGGERTTALTVSSLGLKPGARVLDLGCGYGSTLEILAGQGYDAIGVDLAVEAASAATTAGCVVVGDAERPPITDGSVDGVVMECVLSLLPDKQGAMCRSHRARGSGGRVAISDVTVEQPLPPSLQQVAAWSMCVGGALPTAGYLRLLQETGFADVKSVRLDDALAALIEQIRRRISLIEIALAAKRVDLASLGLDHDRLAGFRDLAAAGLEVVRSGGAGYRLFHATKR